MAAVAGKKLRRLSTVDEEAKGELAFLDKWRPFVRAQFVIVYDVEDEDDFELRVFGSASDVTPETGALSIEEGGPQPQDFAATVMLETIGQALLDGMELPGVEFKATGTITVPELDLNVPLPVVTMSVMPEVRSLNVVWRVDGIRVEEDLLVCPLVLKKLQLAAESLLKATYRRRLEVSSFFGASDLLPQAVVSSVLNRFVTYIRPRRRESRVISSFVVQ